MVKTTDLVADLRVCRYGGCSACGHDCGTAECIDHVIEDAADKIEELVDRCARYAEEIAVLREKVPRWISVDDRRPKPGTRVLATDGVFVGEAYRTSADTWRRYDGIAMRDCIASVVTHWMPLPIAAGED